MLAREQGFKSRLISTYFCNAVNVVTVHTLPWQLVNATGIYHGNQQHSGESQRESGCDVTLGHQAFVSLGPFYSILAQEVVKLKDRAHVADKEYV